MKRHNTRFLTIAATAMMFAVVIGIPAQDMPRPAIPSSGLIGYLASPRARAFRKHSSHPLVQQINRLLGEPVNDEAAAAPSDSSALVAFAASADAVSSS